MNELVSPIDLLSPLTMEIGIGGAGGFLVGYSLKKFVKIILAILGFLYLGLYYLASKGIINIDYSAMGLSIPGVQGQAYGFQIGVAALVMHAPFGAAFIGGLYFGLKKG